MRAPTHAPRSAEEAEPQATDSHRRRIPHREKPDAQTAPQPSWLAGCIAGNADAVAAMFLENRRTVERVLFRLVGPSSELPDLVQTVFAETIRSLPRFRREASFRTWITKIAAHTARHHIRARRLRRTVPLASIPADRHDQDPYDVERALDERRLALRLQTLLHRISPNNRIALLLCGVEGRSAADVAALMGASEVATRSRVFLARRELRALIAKDAVLSTMADALFNCSSRRE